MRPLANLSNIALSSRSAKPREILGRIENADFEQDQQWTAFVAAAVLSKDVKNFVRAPAYAAVKVGTAKKTGYLLRHVDRLHQAAALDVQASAPAISVNG